MHPLLATVMCGRPQGLPVLSSNVGAVPSFVCHGRSGLLLEPELETDGPASGEELAGLVRNAARPGSLERLEPHPSRRSL